MRPPIEAGPPAGARMEACEDSVEAERIDAVEAVAAVEAVVAERIEAVDAVEAVEAAVVEAVVAEAGAGVGVG